MPDREKVIKGLNDIGGFIAGRIGFEQARNFLRTIDDAIALLKEQEAKSVEVCGQMFTVKYGHCPTCGKGMDSDTYPHWCGFCGQAVKWE